MNRPKLGLALSGGGFRAALFHLGVLRRLAELDVLRKVEVISTVSGGSVIAGLYYLLLKHRLEASAELTRRDSEAIIDAVQAAFIAGVRANLRTRMLLNPAATLRLMVSGGTLAERMARMYEAHIYSVAVEALRHDELRRTGRDPEWHLGRIPLSALKIRPGGKDLPEGIAGYNRTHETKVPDLVLNATCLNSGRNWRFTAVEVGDPVLGYVRRDEIERLLSLREEFDYARLETLVRELGHGGTRLLTAEFGELRVARREAWFLRRWAGPGPEAPGGVPREERLRRFWAAIRALGRAPAAALRSEAARDASFTDRLLDAVLDVHDMRLAHVLSPRAAEDFDRISLADAVAASACFPPVFPPYRILGLYEDTHVAAVRLTDGGVYDNQGIGALLEEECTHVIASDAGGLLDIQRTATGARLGMMSRVVSVLTDSVRARRLEALRERRRVTEAIIAATGDGPQWDDLVARYELQGVAFFHMTSSPDDGARDGLAPHPQAEAIARLRTDLDAFGDAEVAALVYQGYALADRFVREYLRAAPFARDDWGPPSQPPLPLHQDATAERRILEAGRSRFFRALRLGAWQAWAFTAVVVSAAVALGLRVHVSVRGAADTAVGALSALRVPVDRAVPAALLLVLVAAVAALAIAAPSLLRLLSRRPALATAAKWARALWRNVLWVLFLLPLWLALAGSVLAAASHYVYARAFLRVTRIR